LIGTDVKKGNELQFNCTKKGGRKMSLMARDKIGGDFTPIPEDLHLAICYGIWDLGTQFSERWEKSVHKVLIVWEIPGCRGDFDRDGKKMNLPRAISKRYRLSLHKKADLRKDLESWRGKKFSDEELKGFDLKRLLGAPCQIQVLHNEVDKKIYANIAAITKAPGGTKLTTENPLKFFSFEDGAEVPEGTPQWIMDLIRHAEEYKGGVHEEHDSPEDSDIPF
jgi:hypothetical protein